tara:strand:- start:130 stop:504 length:375 start_codon:yes stop_codon:yes gene_type:complete
MALSNLDKDVSTRLFQMLSLNDNYEIDKIKNNYSGYGQLMLLAEQIANLQNKAKEIINNISINEHLHSLDITCKKVVGNYYYHYKINNKEVLSIISPEEWNRSDEEFIFLGKYLYNFDNIFYLQ